MNTVAGVALNNTTPTWVQHVNGLTGYLGLNIISKAKRKEGDKTTARPCDVPRLTVLEARE